MTLEELSRELGSRVNQISESLRGDATKIHADIGDLGERMRHVENIIVRLRGSGASAALQQAPSLAASVMDADSFRAYREGKSDRCQMPVQAASILRTARQVITSPIGGDPVSPTIAQPDRAPSIAAGPQQTRWLFQLMPQLPATAGSVEYVRETAFDNQAAPQSAEGAAKAESNMQFELINRPVPTIAHWVKVSRQALSDSAALGRHLDARLIYGLLVKLEAQMIVGDGVGANMAGLLHADNHTAYPGGEPGDTTIDTVRRALGMLEAASYLPDVVILNPLDWVAMELLKDQESRYLLGDPKAPSPNTVWNRIVYPAPSMPQGQFIAAALAQSTSFYSREQALVRLSDSDDDNFRKNLVTALGELRALSVTNVPAGVIAGDLLPTS